MNFTLVSCQDGEVDMKLLTKVLASEQEVKEVSEVLVNIACDLPEKACPAASSTQGGCRSVSQVIKIYDVYINTSRFLSSFSSLCSLLFPTLSSLVFLPI